MPRWAMVIDLDRCTGCQTCMVACAIWHGLPPGLFWTTVVNPHSDAQTGILRTGGDSYPNVDTMFIPRLCNHCDNAPCVKVCPVNATYKREDGLVLIDYERCIGCRYCMAACPYGVRIFHWQEDSRTLKRVLELVDSPYRREGELAEPGYSYGYPEDYRDRGRLVYTRKHKKGIVTKCTFCVERIDRGEKPICVEVCVGWARIFGDLDDPNSEISRYLREKGGAFRLLEDLGTKPRVYYIPRRWRPNIPGGGKR